MSLINNKKEVTITCRNYTYYKSLGYDLQPITKYNKSYNIVVESNDVNPKSKIVLLDFICDNCGKVFQRRAELYYQRLNKTGDYHTYCSDCVWCASRSTMLQKYGVKFGGQVDGAIQKREQTCLNKYGTTHALRTIQSQDKRKETCLHKYGVDSFSKTQEFKDNAKDYFNKANIIMCSKPQQYIADLFNIPTNVYCHGYYLDMLYDNIIDIEYDGSGHDLRVKHGNMTQEEFDALERKRYAAIHSYGLKTLTIIGNNKDILPDKDILKNDILIGINHLLASKDYSYCIDYSNISTIM